MKFIIVDLLNSIVFQTVISGVLVFIFSEFFQKFFLFPLQNYRKTVSDIDYNLRFYANVISNPGFLDKDKEYECSRIFRQLSCELESNYKQIMIFRFLINSNKNIKNASSELIGLSNIVGSVDALKFNLSRPDEIRKFLKITKI